MQNSHIIASLNSYIKNPDPRYALMLKGKWGCGKTFLVNRWIDETFKNPENKDDVVLEPIRVSLYGMTETDQITKAIDRQLHPFLYSKAAKIGAGILKIAGKVVFRTDFDFNNDGNKDATLSTSLDSLSFLASQDKDIKPNSLKLMVFDDLERSHIPMKQLLGYINYFVEICGCHVVIVGDETKVTNKEDKETLDEFKEKTVGKEFEVKPNIDAAIKSFVDELPICEWLSGQCTLIKNVFVASKCDNLRILRQCLYDFKIQYQTVDEKLLVNDKKIMAGLLASFIAVYCEYKGKNKEVITKLKEGSFGFFFSQDDSAEKNAELDMERRYGIPELDGMNILNATHVKNIVDHIEKGYPMADYINGLLSEDQKVVGVLDRLANFREMENDELKHDCDELSQDLMADKYPQFYPIGKALAYFSLFEREKLYQVDETVIEHAKEYLTWLFKERVKDLELLYQCRSAFWQGMNIVENSGENLRIHNEMAEFFNNAFKEREAEIPDKMEDVLNNLKDDNMQELMLLDEKSTPDRHTSYNMKPILKQQNAEMLIERIKGLSNANVRNFAIFLSIHYRLSHNLGDGFTQIYQEDKDTLQVLKPLVEKEISEQTSIRRWNFEYLLKVVDGCIRRSEGVTEPLHYSM